MAPISYPTKALIRSVDLSFVENRIDLSDAFDLESLEPKTSVIIPIEKNGLLAKQLVKTGDFVKTGQIIAQYKKNHFSKVVSTITGEIGAIKKSAALGYPNKKVLSIEIKKTNDRSDDWQNLYQGLKNPLTNNQPDGIEDLNAVQMNELIKNAEIIGMGGAGFPTHSKINPVRYLIINAVECEPIIYTDIALMKDKSKEIISGIEIVLKMIDYSNSVERIHLAIKEKNQDFLTELLKEVEQFNHKQQKNQGVMIEINPLSNHYPSGGEKQIIEQIYQLEIPANQLILEFGFLCLNVATFVAINDAIKGKKACIHRLVSIYNSKKNKIINRWIRIGTRLKDIVESQGLDPNQYFCIIGGPMMGYEVHNLNAGITRTTNCVQIISKENAISKENYDECIRCGYCADSCPMNLLPQELYWSAKNEKDNKLDQLNLYDCIECGICDYVCPSDIPLVHHFRFAKNDLKIKKERQNFSDISKQRFDFREFRLDRAKLERQKKLEEKRKQVQTNKINAEEKKKMIEQALKETNKPNQ